MAEVFHERLKSPIPTIELERRTRELQNVMKREGIDCIINQNVTQYLGGCNRWLTDTLAENNYPQSTILPAEGEIGYIACSGPPLELYPPSHLLRIGKPFASAPYFMPFNFTHTWEGRFAVEWIKKHNAKKIGIAGLEMFFWNYYEYISLNMPDIEIVDASGLFDEFRAIKSSNEIEFIKKSIDLQDKLMGFLPSICLSGVREYEIRSKAMQMLSDLGGEESIILIGSAPRGETFDILPSFFQNRVLEKGDQLYINVSSNGPGGFYTTIGRLFSIESEPSQQMQNDWNDALEAEEKIRQLLQVGSNPQIIYGQYNDYLENLGCKKEVGLFAFGQGYDHLERPSIQPGETMLLAKDMCMAVNVSLRSESKSAYCADSFILKADGAERLHKTPQIIFRT